MQARVSRSSRLAAPVRERANAKNTTASVKVCIALIALVPALAACGSAAPSTSTSAPPSQNTSTPLSPGVAVAASRGASTAPSRGASTAPSRGSAAVAAASSAPPAQESLSCKTDIDPTGAYLPKKDMTAEHLIALLGAMLIVHGRGIIDGAPGQSAANLLNGAQFNLETSYFVGKLSADAARFVADEQTYNPTGPVQASAGPKLEADIRQLMQDCPQSITDARVIANS
jgi:hypothetical protein